MSLGTFGSTTVLIVEKEVFQSNSKAKHTSAEHLVLHVLVARVQCTELPQKSPHM